MSGEQQLERSVLERKERDELHAIAEAMALKPGSRTKKADIIDQILRATGVEVAGGVPGQGGTNGAAPGSDKGRGTAAAAGDTAAGAGDHANGDRAGSPADPHPGDPGASANGGTKAPGEPVRATANGSAVGEAGAGSGDGDSGPRRPRTARSRSVAPAVRATAPGSAGDAGEGSSPGSGERGGSGSGQDTGSPGPAPRSGPGSAPERDPGSTRGSGTGHGSAPGRDWGRDRADRGAPASRTGGDGGDGSEDGARPEGDAHQPGGGRYEGGSEAGNRRGRRRRGRDRGDRGDREPQAGGPEPSFQGEPVQVEGFLDLRDEGFGFLRTSGYLPSPRDVYVSISQVRRFALRKGDRIEGASRPAGSNEKYPALVRIDSVSGVTPDQARQRPKFEDLTPLFPDQRLKLEMPGDPANVTARIVDLLSPIGKGQRGLVVSPPKAGKTTVLKQIAHSIEANNPEVHLMVLLVAERPEEMTDMRRSVKGEVVASTFDRPSEEHTAVAELTIERAKRLVEQGQDVVIVLDGITRLARAYNLAQPATGRIMSGGVDSGALYPPKRFFGAARNVEEGGSLTILATALVETGSRMDEVIFEEFKGTGNMELRLDRRLAERRIYPAIDVNASSTRHEELLFDRVQLAQVWKLRRVLNALGNDGTAAAGLELLMDKIKTTRSNDEFLAEIAKGGAAAV
ncbi:MAG: transcription termination factor Rho [Acidimicrobiales bacterium]